MDYKEYSPDWRDIIRPEILRRDQYKCKHCGIGHKTQVYCNSKGAYTICDSFTVQWAKSVGKRVFKIYLQVAHLDQDKSNNDPANLLSLCPRCHGKYDKQFKSLKRITYKAKLRVNAPKELNVNNAFPYIELKGYIQELTTYKIGVEDLKLIVQFINSKQ